MVAGRATQPPAFSTAGLAPVPVVIDPFERVRAVVAEHVIRVGDVVDADAVEEFAGGELDVEAIVHPYPIHWRGSTAVLRMEALERRIVVPIARGVGDILQLAGARRNEIRSTRPRRFSAC